MIQIRAYYGPEPRPRPKPGDRRTTKKHGDQIRLPVLVYNRRGEAIGYNCTGGRQNYEWVSVNAVPERFAYLLKKGGAE